MSWCTEKVRDRELGRPEAGTRPLGLGKALGKFPVALSMDVGQVAGAERSGGAGGVEE